MEKAGSLRRRNAVLFLPNATRCGKKITFFLHNNSGDSQGLACA